jgi:hypothetical protein
MKPPVLFLISLTALAAPTAAVAQATGKDAMRIVGRDRGADYLPRMLHLFGENGLPQPAVWRVVARDGRGAVHEFYVSKGTIIAEGIIPPAKANGISGTPLPMHRLNIDSKAAFEKADAAARVAKVGFDRINYQLRCLELSTNAAWFIALIDAQGARVGEVCVGASTGTIITQTWFRRPLAVAGGPVPPPPAPKPSFWERTKQGLNQGATSVRHGVGNTAGWIQRKVTPPAPTPPPPVRYVTPPPAR